MTTTTLTSKGQVTIPGSVRSILGLSPGDRVMFTPTSASTAVLSVVPTHASDALFGSITTKKKYVPYTGVRKLTARMLAKKYQIP